MIDPKDARMADPELIGAELADRFDERQRRSSMYAIYSSANEYHLCGFVDAEHTDRLVRFLDPDAGCYPGQIHVSVGLYVDTLRELRIMEGIPSWRP